MKKFFLIIYSLIITFLVARPLFLGNWYPMHDSTHVARVTLMTESIRGGQFPPIWADRAGNGYGYPLFHFYAPLFHLTTSILNLFLNNPYLSLKIILVIAIFLGVYGTYFFARRWGRVAGIFASTAFALSPYLAVNLYVRGAFSEYLSLSLIPWNFYFFRDLSSRRNLAYAALALSLFVLSHNLIPIIVLPALLIWGIYFNKSRLLSLFLTFLLSFLLSSWFILPLLFERQFTSADSIARTTNYALHFISPTQIWNSVWGFGGSVAGVEDGMSFKLGKIQIVFAAIGAFIALLRRRLDLGLISIFALYFFWLSTKASFILWDKLPFFQIVQFPWRSLGPLAFSLSILGAYFISRIPFKLVRLISLAVVVFSMLFFNLKYFVPQSYLDTSTSVDEIVAVVPEYLPKNLNRYPRKPADPIPSKLYGPATVSIDRAYYPNWQATLEGNNISLRPSVMGLIELDVPRGEHDFTLHIGRTNLELLAYTLTLLSLGFLVGLLKDRL